MIVLKKDKIHDAAVGEGGGGGGCCQAEKGSRVAEACPVG